MNYEPVYIETYRSGVLARRRDILLDRMKCCNLCPRKCAVNRIENGKGICKTGRDTIVASIMPHFGEESPLVGRYGSGTIFFTHCNLLCSFCQNYDISHEGVGHQLSDEQLASLMIELQLQGCHNINFVTPTHVVPQIVSALVIAVEMGLRIPLVYNTGGYDNVSTLKKLEGIIDIYMPDIKFFNNDLAEALCHAPDYPQAVKRSVQEMHRQVGDLVIGNDGIAVKGMLIRHLLMPGHLDDTYNIIDFVADDISENSYINLMAQYRPCGNIVRQPEIMRSVTRTEHQEAVEYALGKGLLRIDH